MCYLEECLKKYKTKVKIFNAELERAQREINRGPHICCQGDVENNGEKKKNW